MPKFELLDEIYKSIIDRRIWEQRYRTWTQMRYDGIPRKSKPWPGAANQHSHIADDEICKIKPFYIDEIYASELLAFFTPHNPQCDTTNRVAAEQYFDFKLKKRTNFGREIIVTVDRMLNYGQVVMKPFRNEKKKRLEFQTIEAIDFFCPAYTKDIQDADWLCHQIEIPRAIYLQNDLYNNDPDFVKSIEGNKKANVQDTTNDLMKALREGLNYNQKSMDVIYMWEIWEFDGKEWIVSTWSPFNEDTPIRAPRKNPYDHGKAPFVECPYEITSHGFFSPRGICEIVASEETQANKIENLKVDFYDLTLIPMFTSTIGNTSNIKMNPGQVLAGNLELIKMPPPPVDLNVERSILGQRASQRVGSPDQGVKSEDNPQLNPMNQMQLSLMNNVNSRGSGLRAKTFKIFLEKLYNQAWSLICQFDKNELDYFYGNQSKKLDPNVFTEAFEIEPCSPADGATKEQRSQKSIMRYMLFKDNQLINQEETTRDVIENTDPTKIDRFVLPMGLENLEQAELQNIELMLIQQGKQVVIKQTDVDEVHIQTIIDDMTQHWMQGQSPITFYQMYEQHLLQHMERLRQQKPDRVYNFYKKRINDMIRTEAKMLKQMKKDLASNSNLRTNQSQSNETPIAIA